MARTRSDRARRPPGRRLRRWTGGFVVLLLVLAVASHFLELGPRVLGWEHPSPIEDPAKVAPPPGLTLPSPSPASAVAPTTRNRQADPAKVRRTLAPMLRDKKLGRSVAVQVDQLSDGKTVFDSGPDSVIPASTMKVLTSTAVLAALGPDHRFRTTTVVGQKPRHVVLVGGGDPLLTRAPDSDAYPSRADLATLAKGTARALERAGRTKVRLGYDTSLFSGAGINKSWPASYVPDNVVSPISALWVDEGRERPGMSDRSDDPAAAAARVFARLLEKEGITVRGRPRQATAPPNAQEYAAVRSAPLAQIVQWTLEVSDNEAAEVLFRHVALATDRPGSFTGGSAAVREVLGELGVDASGDRIFDGSGLSRRNRVAPETLVSALELAASDEHPDLRRVVSGLPVAGFTGSLTYRFDSGDEEGLGLVRAKTGTLTGVHGLAGVVTDADGVVYTFVALADKVRPVNTLDARQQIDEMAAALAACTCAA